MLLLSGMSPINETQLSSLLNRLTAIEVNVLEAFDVYYVYHTLTKVHSLFLLITILNAFRYQLTHQ